MSLPHTADRGRLPDVALNISLQKRPVVPTAHLRESLSGRTLDRRSAALSPDPIWWVTSLGPVLLTWAVGTTEVTAQGHA